ncbi:hypothetical protein GGR58DRAFT_488332 [Xylaria digitata]|nr:hypothetical protein GGR58DRAFT_488332 [Xylaria digitata]
MADATFLYSTTIPFVKDYKIKAGLCRRNLMAYDKAPSWAHPSLPCCPTVSDEALMRSKEPRQRMEIAFYRFQTFCEMYNAVERIELRSYRCSWPSQQEGKLPRSERFNQQTMLHDYSRALTAVELDEFRSVMWYVSTLWAILLDEVAAEKYPEHAKNRERAEILVHLCASGFPLLRRALWAPKELRRIILLKRLEEMPPPMLSDHTILWMHGRRMLLEPMCDSGSIPARDRTLDSPISFEFQLQLRAQAWVFFNSRQVLERHDLVHRRMCCHAVIFLPYRCQWGHADPTRWLNPSPVCYGGLHKDFYQY